MTSKPVFQVSVPGAPGGTDVLGLWEGGPAVPASMPDASELWRAELPAELGAADALLREQSRRVAALSTAFPAAEARLRADLAGLERSGVGGLNFGLDRVDPQDPLAILAAAQEFQSPSGPGAADFGVFDFLKPDRAQVDGSVDLLGRFTRQVSQAVENFALVETVIGGRRLFRTRASWSGDVETWWVPGALPDERRQHEQVLAQALATRQGWLRFLLLVAGGIPRVAGVLAAGPFSPLAIWATWNYFQQVLKAYREAVQVTGAVGQPVS